VQTTAVSPFPAFNLPLEIDKSVEGEVKSAWLRHAKRFFNLSGDHARITGITGPQTKCLLVSSAIKGDSSKCSKIFWGTLKVVGWMTIILPLIAYIAIQIFHSLNPMLNEDSRVARLVVDTEPKMKRLEDEVQKLNKEKGEMEAKHDKAIGFRLARERELGGRLNKNSHEFRKKEEAQEQEVKHKNQQIETLSRENTDLAKRLREAEQRALPTPLAGGAGL